GCRYRGLNYDLDLEGEHFHLRSLLIAFANGPDYGMGARIAPEARLDDGLLDACVAADRSVLARFWHVRHLALGSIARAPEVILRKVRTATVASAGPLEYHVDGEWGRAEGKLEVRIAPGALLVKGQG
ncbi:MAG TPA: hypothetical protein VLD67_01490, partial [Vicinamibacterales bacterium]|nr:hypothetical protein [Vicinamibacterales bacterium]